MTRVPDFDRLYADDPDPWRVATSFYERRKQALLLAALARERYACAWDTASGTGRLAAALAVRCDRVIATDGSAAATELTRRTSAGAVNLEVGTRRLPGDGAPDVRPDLVVLAEFLYYLEEADRGATLALVDDAAATSAEVVGVHWRHHPHDAHLSGAAAQAEVGRALEGRGWRRRVHVDDPDFVLDSWERGEP